MLHGRVVRPPAPRGALENVDESSVTASGLCQMVRQGDFLGVVAETEWAAVRLRREIKTSWSDSETLPDREAMGACARHQDLQGRCHQHIGEASAAMARARRSFARAMISPSIRMAPSAPPAHRRIHGRQIDRWSASQATHICASNWPRCFRWRLTMFAASMSRVPAAMAATAMRTRRPTPRSGESRETPVRVQWSRATNMAGTRKDRRH